MRELRQHASRWLARVAAGDSFEITDRGRPVAALVPLAGGRWEALLASGAAVPALETLADVDPLPGSGREPLSSIVDADRDDR